MRSGVFTTLQQHKQRHIFWGRVNGFGRSITPLGTLWVVLLASTGPLFWWHPLVPMAPLPALYRNKKLSGGENALLNRCLTRDRAYSRRHMDKTWYALCRGRRRGTPRPNGSRSSLVRAVHDPDEAHQCNIFRGNCSFDRFLVISPHDGAPQISTAEGKTRKTRFWHDRMTKRPPRTAGRVTEHRMHPRTKIIMVFVRFVLFGVVAKTAPPGLRSTSFRVSSRRRGAFAPLVSPQALPTSTVVHELCP